MVPGGETGELVTTAPAPPSKTQHAGAATDAPALSLAERFVKDLLAPGGRDAWYSTLTPLCTSSYADRLMLVDPTSIPDQLVNGKPSTMPGGAIFVPTTAQGYTVHVVKQGADLRVDDATPGRR